MRAPGSGNVPRMTDPEAVHRWAEGYVRAWESTEFVEWWVRVPADALTTP